MSDFPSVAEELERKVAHELDLIITKYEKGAIHPREAFIRVNSLWDIAAGLVSRETMDLVANFSTVLKTEGAGLPPVTWMVVLIDRKGIPTQVVLRWNLVQVVGTGTKVFEAPGEVVDTCAWAKNKFKEIVAMLKVAGYKVVGEI